MLNEDYVNWFSLGGRSYQVIPQVRNQAATTCDRRVEDYQIRTGSGELVPLSTLVTISEDVVPSKRTQFQQLNSITLSGVMTPGVPGRRAGLSGADRRRDLPAQRALGLQGRVAPVQERGRRAGGDLLPVHPGHLPGARGAVRELARPVRDPDVGAAVHLRRHGLPVPRLRQHQHLHPGGLITLIGLIAKNGILIVEFANQLREHEGLDKRAAVEQASQIRLRPILMTTVAMLVAMVPLLIASGPGAVSRFDIGLVITTGLGIGTLFTLFIVPESSRRATSR
jgi:multidrug efflux pump